MQNPRSEAWRAASAAVLARVRPDIPWNKGRTYVIAKRTVYANKGAWAAALIRLYGNACMRCGWKEARCDAHHLIPKGLGGAFSIDNGILLCPNCHRVSHYDTAVQESLTGFKARASVICPSY
jgi:5-methylcytosine-specific restriction endonuclease McrA